jgi:hypothetical protein
MGAVERGGSACKSREITGIGKVKSETLSQKVFVWDTRALFETCCSACMGKRSWRWCLFICL